LAAAARGIFLKLISHTCAKTTREIIMTKALFLLALACALLLSPGLAQTLRALPDRNDDFGAI
jgi:hypothetical protein